jgi:hypothetical protein
MRMWGHERGVATDWLRSAGDGVHTAAEAVAAAVFHIVWLTTDAAPDRLTAAAVCP